MFGRRDAARLMRDALAHADALHNFARHLTGDPADAEDLVQETYARALAGRFDGELHLKAWLFRILRNTHLDLGRRRQSRRTEPGLDAENLPAPHAGERQIAGHDVERAMSTLAEEARLAILLDLEGFSEAEMAALLDCAPGTVKSRLSRARAALREKLEGYGK
jgi:RNA polymerase sigma-70 factor, ECF subfamily